MSLLWLTVLRTVHYGSREVMMAEAQGSWSRGICSQEVERGEGWTSAPFLQDPVQGMGLPTYPYLEWILCLN